MSEESFLSSGDPGSAFQTLVRHFEENEFRFVSDPSARSVQFFVNGEYAVYNCRVQLTHDDEVIQGHVYFPVTAKEHRIRPLVAETVARANHGMSIGGLDIDMDTGDISYHLGQVIRGRELDDEIIGGVLSAGLATADRYFPAFMRVMFAGHTPADAVYLSELDVHAEAVEDERPARAPAPPSQAKPSAKKPRAPRKDPRLKSTRELPGLFDTKPGDDQTGPTCR